MAAIRFSMLKSSQKILGSVMKSAGHVNPIDVRPLSACVNRSYITKQVGFAKNNVNNGFGMMGVYSFSVRKNNVGTMSSTLSNLQFGRSSGLIGISQLSNPRLFSASASSTGNNGNDLANRMKDAWESSVNVATQSGEKAKEALSRLTPHVDKLLDANPYLRDVIVPVSGTMVATIMAWVVMPKILRRLHKYSIQGPGALFSGSTLWGPVPYEKSFWGAMEDPLRYLITFMAFSQIGMMVAPTTIASQYITPLWRGGVILSFVWFLQRWKANVISRTLAAKKVERVDRDRMLTLDRISSVGLFVLGGMALAEICGVPVQSILTVGGIGGVATAFAARDVLGNVLSGLSVQMSQPFSIGDTIKAGSVEGQVIEMGLMTTSLLSAEKFPVIVPNSLFSSQVIVNKSRAEWRAMVTKIPLQLDDFDKIPQISDEIKTTLRSNANVFLEKEPPYCYLSRVERSYAELTVGCNLKHMSKDKLLSAEQDVLLQSLQIIKKHGAALGSTWDNSTNL